jgi:hypothetical protein
MLDCQEVCEAAATLDDTVPDDELAKAKAEQEKWRAAAQGGFGLTKGALHHTITSISYLMQCAMG